jgi:hypothetical protein
MPAPTPGRPPRLAVLIDADNTSPKVADGLFDEVAKIGEASLRRIYGDFSKGQQAGWEKVLARHAILPQQQFAYTTGKNSTDITLVIDAMDLLHSGRFDGFCLVSSDSDFTRLAARIREQGVDVYGIGRQKTPEAFRQACTRFIFTENFVAEDPGAAPAASTLRPVSEAADPSARPSTRWRRTPKAGSSSAPSASACRTSRPSSTPAPLAIRSSPTSSKPPPATRSTAPAPTSASAPSPPPAAARGDPVSGWGGCS